jgi:hypothetical protein
MLDRQYKFIESELVSKVRQKNRIKYKNSLQTAFRYSGKKITSHLKLVLLHVRLTVTEVLELSDSQSVRTQVHTWY